MKKHGMKSIIKILLTLAIIFEQGLAFAQTSSSAMNMPLSSAREYFVGRDLGRPLVTVRLINGVTLPGVYHVPEGTDLAELIAFAGGATEKSDLTEIVVRRRQGKSYSIMDIDLHKALNQPEDLFRIQDQDIVRIEQQVSVDRTLQYVGIASALASVVLSVFMVRDLQNR